MPKIFISYSSIDRPAVETLVKALNRFGWSVFWDGDIQPAENWHQKIAEELADAACTIVLWTKNAVRSFWVIEEAMYSRQRGVLLPVLLENVSPPPGFLTLQCLDLSSWRNDEGDANFRRLCNAIAGHTGDPMNVKLTEAPAARTDGEADDAMTRSVATRPAPRAYAYVYEGESVPWLNWSALLLASLCLVFQEQLFNAASNFLEGIIRRDLVQSIIVGSELILVLFAYKPILWNSKRLNTKEVTAVFVICSLALFQLMTSIFTASNVRVGTLRATETGQLAACAVIVISAVVVWVSRDYQKSWLEVSFLWLLSCVAAVKISVYTAMAHYGDASAGFGRLYPSSTGLLVGSALIALSTALLLVVRFRHMSVAELVFFWVFGSAGLIGFVRTLSIALFGRQQEIQILSGTFVGLGLAICIGIVLATLRTRMVARVAS